MRFRDRATGRELLSYDEEADARLAEAASRRAAETRATTARTRAAAAEARAATAEARAATRRGKDRPNWKRSFAGGPGEEAAPSDRNPRLPDRLLVVETTNFSSPSTIPCAGSAPWTAALRVKRSTSDRMFRPEPT